MIELKLPPTIKIGGYDYTIEISPTHNQELRANGNRGECISDPMKRIRIDSDVDSQQFSGTFIHEITHAIDNVYSNNSLTEAQTAAIANGFLQVLEQFNIRFFPA